MATLINGNGNPAIYAQQDADFYNGIMGPRTRILNVGSKMAATIEDANTIAIADGVIITKEGRRVQVDVGNVDEFIIPTGQAGATRYYIIGYHLYTDGSANQLCETFVQLMANGTDTIPEDTFRGGSTDVYVSLYRVKQDGITLDTIQSLLPEGVDLDGIGDEIDDIKDDIDQINSDLTELSNVTTSDDSVVIGKIFGNKTLYRKYVEFTTTGSGEYQTAVSSYFPENMTYFSINPKSYVVSTNNYCPVPSMKTMIYSSTSFAAIYARVNLSSASDTYTWHIWVEYTLD